MEPWAASPEPEPAVVEAPVEVAQPEPEVVAQPVATVPGVARKYPTLSKTNGSPQGQILSVYKTRESNPQKVADFKAALENGDCTWGGANSIPSFDVLSWLAEQDVSLIRIDWRGQVVCVTSRSGYAANPYRVQWQRETRADEIPRMEFSISKITRLRTAFSDCKSACDSG